MIRLILVRGLPGSGKSTIASNLVATGAVDCYFEADMFFNTEEGYKFDGSKLGAAHQWCQAEVKKFLDAGMKVAVSNTFTQRWEAQAYLDMVPSSDVEVITAEGSFQNTHGVPPLSIERMKTRWETF